MNITSFIAKLGLWVTKWKRSSHLGNNKQYRTMFKSGHAGSQVYTEDSVVGLGEPEPGDLCLVPLEIFLSAPASAVPLPGSFYSRFIVVDVQGVPKTENVLSPMLSIFCVIDLDTFLSLTADDYTESLHQTKLWQAYSHAKGGLWRFDYVTKYDKTPENALWLKTKQVDLYNVHFRDSDFVSIVPGVVETRLRRHWFYPDKASLSAALKELSFRTTPPQEIELPVAGMTGTVLKKKEVVHSYDSRGNIVVGNTDTSMFYQILFHDRVPVWVQGPVWKCPDDLILPIYLPIP